MKRGKNVNGFKLDIESLYRNPKLIIEDDDGFWRLYEFEETAATSLYRAYHKHGDDWICQLTIIPVCAKCRARAPEAMIGFEELIKWEV